MKRYILLPDTTYQKANLHAHTTLSDGKLTPGELRAAYQARGYSVVAITDHRRYAFHEELCDDSFLALAAFEADINDWPGQDDYSFTKTYHLNFYDTCPASSREEKRSLAMPERRYSDIHAINGYIERMRELGFLCCYNHPYWSLQTLDDYRGLRGCFAMEIYNHGCELDGPYGFNPQVYDEMLRTGNRLGCVMTDDNHNAYPFGDPRCDSFGGFTMIGADKPDYAQVIDALRQGRFYSSMGPLIHEITLEDNVLHVRCSPVEKIYVVTAGRRCYLSFAPEGETITEASFEIRGNDGYLRVDCRDGRGLHACSNAYFLDSLR